MCRHVLNSKVYVQAPCCSLWFECSECHDEHVVKHRFQFSSVLRFTCKNCRKCFERDFKLFSDKDKYCDHCNTLWVMPGITHESKIVEETKDILINALYDVISPDKPFYNTIP